MKTKINNSYLLCAFFILIIGFTIIIISANIKENEEYKLQLEAAFLMQEAQEYLKQRIIDLGHSIEEQDLNKTLLIGPEYSELMTTMGDAKAKRTSLNPNWAAAMVRWYTKVGLKKGDKIAIGTSGSFPGFAIASTIAATVMNLDAKVIASLGASMYGATRVDYNIFDILLDIKDAGFASFDLLAISGGGENDFGIGAWEGFIYENTPLLFEEICKNTSIKSNAYYIKEDNLEDSIQKRLTLYGEDVKLFVNIGGASVNCGTSSYSLNFPQGLVMPEDISFIPNVSERGLNFEYIQMKVPVLNLLNVKLLAVQNNIAFDSIPMQKAGSSGVYTSISYNKYLIITTLVLTILVLVYGYRKTKKDQIES